MIASSLVGNQSFVGRDVVPVHKVKQDRGSETTGVTNQEVALWLQSGAPWAIWLCVDMGFQRPSEFKGHERNETFSAKYALARSMKTATQNRTCSRQRGE